MPTFTSQDGTTIACERTGSGPPLVLVHGTSADHRRWAPVLPAFQRHFTVYACDRRGRGASGDADDYAIEREFEDIAAVVDGIGGPVDLVGHSWGALCSLEAASRAKNLRRLVLFEPPIPIGGPIYPPGVVDRLQALLDAGDREAVVTTFMTEVPRVPPDQLALMKTLPAWPARVAAAHTIVRELKAHERYAFDPASARVTAPTLLLLGGDSPPFFAQGLERVKQGVPHAQLVVLPGQQHVAIDTAPELFAREVLAFLRAPDGG
jgi:pimeloyl-ACP methyl ester carboxylesterase